MKVLLVTDYFYPFNPGGTEWSVYKLAGDLRAKTIDAQIVTLNYGSKGFEKVDGIPVHRLPFWKKLSSKRKTVNPVHQNNPVFFFQSFIELNKLVKIEKPNVIHVHGKFLIPASILSGAISNTPVVVTVRDKQLLCSIGKCFFDGRQKACNSWEYLTRDLPWFYKNYVPQKNLLKLIYVTLGAIWSRAAYSLIKILLKRANIIVAISDSQKKYFNQNGFKKVLVIYNTENFKKLNKNHKQKNERSLLFAGKLSNGKGINLLLDAAKIINNKYKFEIFFAGEPDSSFKLVKNDNFKYLNGVNQANLKKLYLKASLTVMPSIYPEAFGRVALESLASGTPVVVTNTGALPEIIKDKVTGRVVNTNPKALAEGIIDVLSNNKKYRNNIKKLYLVNNKKFHDEPIRQHLELYNSLSK